VKELSEPMKTIKVKVFRYDPKKDEKGRYETYEVPITPGMSVLDVLDYIYANIDSSLSYYYSCHRGYNACCMLVVNGKIIRPCTTLATEDMTIEPLKGRKIIKDLVVESDLKQ